MGSYVALTVFAALSIAFLAGGYKIAHNHIHPTSIFGYLTIAFIIFLAWVGTTACTLFIIYNTWPGLV